MERISDGKDFQSQPNRIVTPENMVCLLAFILFLVIYLITLCPVVFWWDSGELIANVAVLGIPHRPGFPIYLLLAKVFSFIPFWSFALRVNLVSAVCAALSLAILFKTFLVGVHFFFPRMTKNRRGVLLSGMCFVLLTGFTYSFWIQAVRAEVYSLNALFFSLLFFLCLLYLRQNRLKYVCLFFFLLGLGLGNHHLSLLSTVPALGFILLTSAGPSVIRWKRTPFYVIFLLLGLSVYLYLPIRQVAHPPLAWGNMTTVSASASSIFALDSVKQINFEFLSKAITNVEKVIVLSSDQLTFLCFGISLIGLLIAFRTSRKFFVFLLLILVGNCAAVSLVVTEFMNTNPDLHGYLIFFVFALALAYGTCILYLLNRILSSKSAIRLLFVVALVGLSLLPLIRHHSEANLSSNRIAHNYGLSVISDLDSNSVLFVDNVNLSFILRELQYGEGIRSDVTVIDRGLLGFKWYAEQKRKELKTLSTGIPEYLTGESLFRTLLKKHLDSDKSTYLEFTERDSSLVNLLAPRGYVFKVNRNPVGRLSGSNLLYQQLWDRLDPFEFSPESGTQPNSNVFERDWDAQRVFALSFYRLGLFYEWKGMTSHALYRFSQIRRIDPHDQELLTRIKRLQDIEAFSETPNHRFRYGG